MTDANTSPTVTEMDRAAEIRAHIAEEQARLASERGPAITAGMAGLDEHFHAKHDDEDSVEECCIAAILSAAGFVDTWEAHEAGRAAERQRWASRVIYVTLKNGERERVVLADNLLPDLSDSRPSPSTR